MDIKVCGKCEQPKDLEEFAIRSAVTGKRQSWCKTCKNEYDKQSYHSSSVRRKAVRERDRASVARNVEFVRLFLTEHPCIDCGETDIVVLEFDHVRGEKVESISLMARSGVSLETLEKEINKCVVRCANDHRRKTHRDWDVGKFGNPTRL